MRILIDMNLSPKWSLVLKDAGIESVHWSDLGPATTPDPEIMEIAATNNLTILTNDLDFGIALASALRTKPSVVQIRSNDLRPTSIGKQVSQALNQMKEELEMEPSFLSIRGERESGSCHCANPIDQTSLSPPHQAARLEVGREKFLRSAEGGGNGFGGEVTAARGAFHGGGPAG
jgi:predicted nuclease of predicted toxin-antitoxin system